MQQQESFLSVLNCPFKLHRRSGSVGVCMIVLEMTYKALLEEQKKLYLTTKEEDVVVDVDKIAEEATGKTLDLSLISKLPGESFHIQQSDAQYNDFGLEAAGKGGD